MEEEGAEAEAGEEEEGVEAEGLSAAVGVEGGDDAGEGRVGHVVAEREGGGEESGDEEGDVGGEGGGGEGGEEESGGDEEVAAEFIRGAADDGAEEHAGDSVAEEGETDAAVFEVIAAGKVEAEPGEDSGLEEGVEEDEGVGALGAGDFEEGEVVGEDDAKAGGMGGGLALEECAVFPGEEEGEEEEGADEEEFDAPAEGGIEECAEG